MAGRPKKIKKPEHLEKWFKEYRKDTKDNPFLKMDFKGSPPKKVFYELEKPLSWQGFKLYIHEHYQITNLDQYKANKNGIYDEYSSILGGIGSIIHADQLTGALIGIYSAKIVARKMNLESRRMVEVKNSIIETKVRFE